MIEELTDLAMIDGSQVADNASVLIIKNNIKLISKVFLSSSIRNRLNIGNSYYCLRFYSTSI